MTKPQQQQIAKAQAKYRKERKGNKVEKKSKSQAMVQGKK